MKTKTIKYLFAGLAFTMFSCDNYMDVNEDPNNIHQEDIHPALMLPGAMTGSYRVQATTMNRLGNIFMQNWGANVNNFTAANNDEYRLSVDNTFYSGIWDGLYVNINNYQQIINYNAEDYDNHKAVAYIMKSYYMQYIVDLYGDCPYSQAFMGQENTTPGYDDDRSIYRDLITSIDKGMALFYSADANDKALGTSDVIFGGSPSRWLKFANTLKLRILLRQSGLADTATQTYINDQLDVINASGVLFLDEDATINPGYNRSSAAGLNPFYAIFRTAGGNATQSDGFFRATDYVGKFLNGDFNGGIVDNRRERLYTLVDGDVIGAVQGEITGPAEMSLIGPGLIDSYDQDGIIMTLAEAKFILAEMSYLYPAKLSAFDPQTEFENGIVASFDYLGATGAGTYIGNISGVSELGWAGNVIESIATQKWIATNGLNAIESYIEYTRTGFPAVPLATTAQHPNRPYRLMYPSSEYISNAANVPNVTSAQVFVQGPFWKN